MVVAVAVDRRATAPRSARARRLVRSAASSAVTAVVHRCGWQVAAGGPLGADALAAALASPVVVLLPPALAFLLALGS